MYIKIAEEIGSSFLKVLASESSTWELDFMVELKRLDSGQIKAVLNWVRGEITWGKSKIWKSSDRDVRVLELIDNALYEAEFCKKNLATRPRKYKR